jgi:hypothetical protein
MHKVHLKISGDQWLNPQQVTEELSKITDAEQWVCFDTGAEGISLKHSGILQIIDHWVETSGHRVDRVVVNSPNNVEQLPYENLNKNAANHFFAMSGHYARAVAPLMPTARIFGLFLGRHTQQRNVIASDCHRLYNQHFLFSIMRSSYNVSPWSKDLHGIESLDNLFVRDQYTGTVDTNASLLDFYPQFQIELVAETCCHGETFFPTEKTIRPLLGKKPVLIFGPRFFLANLRKLGFRTYDQCWNESYDELEGSERWQAMLAVIDTIVQQGYDRSLADTVANHNAQHLQQWHRYTTSRNMPRVIHDS